MSSPIITVENLSKRYVIGHQRSKDDGLRHVIEDAMRAPLNWLRSRREQTKRQSEEFWALKDVSFEVKQGEVLGIIGRNGAGKSTLLKILSRITEPTSGRISIDGRVASLLEVGTGFHPELTGRENIFLNGAILGMSRIEIKRKFDEIVAFSEVDRFLDTPVKRYSSGMYVRLAFAVAAHLEPEILIVDEVLAVGDQQFQNKCIGKIQEVSRSGGRTVLFVSHNMMAVRTLCTEAIFFSRGTIQKRGTAAEVTDAYLANAMPLCNEHSWINDASPPGNEFITFRRLAIQPTNTDAFPSIRSPLIISLDFINRYDRAELDCCFHLKDVTGQIVFTAASFHSERRSFPSFDSGIVGMQCTIPGDLLNNGVYTIDIQINKNVDTVIFKMTDALNFEIADNERVRGGYVGLWPGLIRPMLQWSSQATAD